MDTDTAAVEIRRSIIRAAGGPKGAHVGGSLSCADILAVLHFDVMGERDTFILSKGHAAPALYATLAVRGLLEAEELDTYARPGSRLFGHPRQGIPGVAFPTGSLGHGLGLAIGTALGERLDGGTGRVYVLLGDGELQEGSVWEAAMYAGTRGLDNLVAVVDRNSLQITGSTEERAGLEPLAGRFAAFGWETRDVDGHDTCALSAAARGPAQRRPLAVIARTVKGSGVPFLEGKTSSHYATLRPELVRRALTAVEARRPT
ncbi:transketolase subunit A [Haloactinospora alba]|uniref:Transketolase subunit A n=1 Tax=Haloactinospora alba TaxID=405555 RepID=A0A543N965_9ACTN|nr:transketolase [Haloactinospora alba]TQN28373.1 transketolase subunit A [Haloactinospora alba]